MEQKNNALVTSKQTKKGYNVLVMTLTLKNGEQVTCEIVLNPYHKNGLGKLYYKICQNL